MKSYPRDYRRLNGKEKTLAYSLIHVVYSQWFNVILPADKEYIWDKFSMVRVN